MRSSIAAAAAAAFLGAIALPARAEPAPDTAAQVIAAPAFSAQQKRRARTGQSAGSGQQIACTQLGCHPIPRGCRVVPGKIPFTWDPSGFDDIVCPYPR